MPRTDAGSRRSFYITLVLVVVVMVTILVFNRHGLIELAGLKGQVDSISTSVDSLSSEIDSLQSEIERLRNDSLYLESKVREILGWGREGEFVIRFPEPDSSGGLF